MNFHSGREGGRAREGINEPVEFWVNGPILHRFYTSSATTLASLKPHKPNKMANSKRINTQIRE